MKLLVVNDDPEVIGIVNAVVCLQEPNWEILATTGGQEAVTIVEQQQPDLVLLDLALPDMDGFSVLKEIRLFSDVPVVMLTACHDEVSTVTALELGADDYITKPFRALELVARARAVLRRAEGLPLPYQEPFACDEVRVDFHTRRVTVGGRLVELTATEYRLLYHLVRNAGRPLRREALLARVWGHEYTHETSYLKVYINRLRNKIEPDPQHPEYIRTEHRFGYSFRAP